MSGEKITALTSGTPKNTDLHIAVDTTDTTMAPTGTDKKYLLSDISSFILKSISPLNTIYCQNPGGNDSTGNGSISNPYLTLNKAITSITDASASKIYSIKLSGVFNETTILLKPYINIDGQESKLTITNPLALDSSFASIGGEFIFENFSSIILTGGLNLDFSTCPTSICFIKNILIASTGTWNIKGSASNPTIAFLFQNYGTSTIPALTIQDCHSGLIGNSFSSLSVLSTSATLGYNVNLFNNIVSGNLSIEADAGANNSVVLTGNEIYGTFLLKTVSTGISDVNQQSTQFNNITLDGIGMTWNTDLTNVIPTLFNGATISSNVIYRSISNGITANFASPLHYTPVDSSVNGHLRGIDAALGGAGSTFLLAANNLSDVASVSTSRTNLGLGTIATQNSSSVSITGGTIDGTAIGNTTPSTLKASSITDTNFSTAGIVHNDATGLFSSSLIVNADVSPTAAIVDTKLATISTSGKVLNSATTATSLNTANSIVSRDASGNFSAGTITASLNGNAATATSSINFTGSLSGDVTGTQSATVISNNVVTNSKLAQMPANTFKANILGASANPQDITVSQMQSALGVGTATLNSTQIGFGSGTNLLTGSSNFTWNDSTKILTATGPSGSQINLGSTISYRKIVLFDSHPDNFQFYGFSVQPSSLIYNIDASLSNHIFVSGVNSSSSLELMRIAGNGNVSIKNLSTSGIVINNSAGLLSTRAITATQVSFGDSSNQLTGSANLTWNDTTKVLGITGAGGITLPTTGATAAILNYYEELVFNVTFSYSSSTIVVPFTFRRIGKSVTMSWNRFAVTPSAPTVFNGTTTPIPSRFFDSTIRRVYQITGIEPLAGLSIGSTAILIIETSGILVIANAGDTNFTGTWAGSEASSISLIVP